MNAESNNRVMPPWRRGLFTALALTSCLAAGQLHAAVSSAGDPGDVDSETWGTVTFTFENCKEGTVHYNSTTDFGSGVYEIVKVYNTEQQMCP